MDILNVYPLQAKENKMKQNQPQAPVNKQWGFAGRMPIEVLLHPASKSSLSAVQPCSRIIKPCFWGIGTNVDSEDQRGQFAKKQRWWKVASERRHVGGRLREFQQKLTKLHNQGGAEEESSLHSNRRVLRF